MKKYENFCNALDNLKEIFAFDQNSYDSIVVLTGLVGLFEICFEQSWKAIKEVLEEAGFAESQTGSPRQIIKTAFQAGMIKDEDAWLSALVSRNNVAHAYNQVVAIEIVEKTKEIYYKMFSDLRDEIDRNWL